jgi:hypothetical protein
MKKLKAIKSVTIRNKRYRFALKKHLIEKKEARGLTDAPDTKGKAVFIDPDQSQKDMLATLIDEFLHCAIWELRNDVVDQISDDLAHALWRCGLRFSDSDRL